MNNKNINYITFEENINTKNFIKLKVTSCFFWPVV